jgi:probable rRNA maturation factor
MEHEIILESELAQPFPYEDLIKACITQALAAEGVNVACEINVLITHDEGIHQINLEQRGVDRPTDVLSLECERPDDPDLGEDEPCELGDIVLAPDYIGRQAASFGTTPADECRLLLVHGMLHLLGYDHMEDDEAEEMEAREDELCALLSTDVPLGHIEFTRHDDEALR